MSKKIFWNIIIVSLLVLVAGLGLTTGILFERYTEPYVESLKDEASSLSRGMQLCGREYLEGLQTEHRVTLIDADGTVLFDSEADPGAMENHLTREEVQQALQNGYGYTERESATLSEKRINYAILLKDGTVLRISDTRHTIFSLLGDIAPSLTGVLVLAILISLVLALRVAKSITAPINRIDLEHPERTHVYAELTPLVDKISAQNRQIEQQMSALTVEHEKQDAMRRDFTANVSHELKTPLTSISGYAEIMKNGIAREEDIRRFAGKIYDESQRLITLVGDIIKLSQLDDKDIAVTMEDIDLYDTCKAIFSQLEMAAQERQVTMSLVGEHLQIHSAGQIVEEIIFNLCDNAIKYNKVGGRVEVSLKQYVDGVELAVADTGIGIAQADLPHIFERFFRVDKSHSKEIGGTGLGLSIVKHGVKFLGAKVSMESEIGKGTTIRVLF